MGEMALGILVFGDVVNVCWMAAHAKRVKNMLETNKPLILRCTDIMH